MNEMKKNEIVDKPFSMVCEEFKMGLANLINNSALPMFVIESVLENYLNEVKSFARQQYQNDKTKYEKALFKQDDEKEQETKQ